MYRLVISEDEQEFRETIVSCIKNAGGEEYQVVGEAANGLEAIEQVKECSPDILITDICMPKLDGLEMIRRVLEIKPDIETVIISGYDDFKYVKEAMKMGVRDYLLKPFLPDELFHVLGKISSELKRKATLFQNIEYMHQQIEENKVYSREKFLRELLENKEEAFSENRAACVDFDSEADWYACCTIRFFRMEGQSEEENFVEMMKKYLQIVEENYFPVEIRCYNLNFDYNQVILILCCHEKHQRTAAEAIRTGMEKIGKSMERYYYIRMRCTMGYLVSDYRKLAGAYREALKTWRSVWEQEELLVVYDGEKGGNARKMPDERAHEEGSEAIRSSLLMSIQLGQKESACAGLNELLQRYSRLPADQFHYISVSLVELVLSISNLTAKAVGERKAREDEAVIDFLENYMKYGSLLEAKQVLEKYIEKSCEEFQRVNEKQGDKIVNTAVDFIEANLANEELGIDLVADSLHFSSNYIRKLFRSSLGESFSDFLFRKRMEKAAALLRNPSYKIQDIAEQTGYSNQRYFARCFKKYYDCTPSEYRGMQE